MKHVRILVEQRNVTHDEDGVPETVTYFSGDVVELEDGVAAGLIENRQAEAAEAPKKKAPAKKTPSEN